MLLIFEIDAHRSNTSLWTRLRLAPHEITARDYFLFWNYSIK